MAVFLTCLISMMLSFIEWVARFDLAASSAAWISASGPTILYPTDETT
jgi:hypothetical protein